MNRREQRFFNKAKEASKKAEHYKTSIGAVLVLGNYVVCSGWNREKTHPVQARYDQKTKYHGTRSKLHAEIDALISSGRVDLTGAEIYIYREDKHGNLASSKPCSSCTKALQDAGVKHIYYTNKEGYVYERW